MRSRKVIAQEIQDWEYTVSCDYCQESYTWNGKAKDRNYRCGGCGLPMRVENRRKENADKTQT